MMKLTVQRLYIQIIMKYGIELGWNSTAYDNGKSVFLWNFDEKKKNVKNVQMPKLTLTYEYLINI